MRLNKLAGILLLAMWSLFASGIMVVTGENPSELEEKAAEELLLFLSEISSDGVEVVAENAPTLSGAIYLGYTQFAHVNGILLDEFDQEEWIVQSVGNNLVISGGRPAGTLYGVYRFLEKNGVWFLREDATVIPEKGKIILSGYNEQKKPAFPGRYIYDGHAANRVRGRLPLDSYFQFLLRSFSNGRDHRGRPSYYDGDMFRIGGPTDFHSYFHYLPPKKYFETHPEYFNMNEQGERFMKTPPGAQPCFSHPDVERIMTEALENFIEADRARFPKEKWPVVYDLSRMDATKFVCLCPECKKISDEEGSDSGIEVRFINKLARSIASKYPDILLRTYGYASSEQAPKFAKPEPNVIIQYCDLYTKSDPYRPLESPFNREQLAKLLAWKETGCKLSIWDYWHMGSPVYYTPPRPEVVIDALQPDFKLFRKLEVSALFLEGEKSIYSPQPFMNLHYFVAYKLMVDPDRDVEALIDIYLKGCYGKAAPLMQEYLAAIRKGVKEYPKSQRTMFVNRWDFLTPEFMLKTYRDFKAAEKLVADQPEHLTRVRDEMISPLWTTMFYRNNYEKIFEDAGISFEALINECHTLVETYLKRDNPADLEKRLTVFNQMFEVIKANLPTPDKFKDVSDEDIRVFGYPHAKGHEGYQSFKIDDPESPTGKTICSRMDDPKLHGVKGKTPGGYPANRMGVYTYGATKPKMIFLREIPTDEDYHWYKIPEVELGSKSVFYAHFWYITYDLSSAYGNADGMESANVYDVWVSARFTGPEWVPGSQKENSISVDQVVLVRANKEITTYTPPAIDPSQAIRTDGLEGEPWSIVGGGKGQTVIDTQNAHSGKSCCLLENGACYWETSLKADAGDKFRFEVYAKGTGSMKLSAWLHSNEEMIEIEDQEPHPLTDAYQRYSYIFTCPVDTEEILVAIASNGSVYFDDAAIYQLPVDP